MVALLPCWLGDDWFSELASHGLIQFIEGYVKFNNNYTASAPWPVMVVIFTKRSMRSGRKLSAELLNIPKP